MVLGQIADPGVTVPGSVAFLLSQPVWREGLPVLPAYSVGHYAAEYDLDGVALSVYLSPDRAESGRPETAERPAPSGIVSWQPFFCPVVPLERNEIARNPATRTLRANRDGYTVYFTVPAGFVSTCDVAAAFVLTLEFFLELEGINPAALSDPAATRMPFPAVLDIAG
jgi:hypothetical protein